MQKADRSGSDPLPSWNDSTTSGAKEAIMGFVRSVTNAHGAHFVDPSERIAVFDNDGTLWGEQPMYVQIEFIKDRLTNGQPDHAETIEEYSLAALEWLATTHHDNGMLYTEMVYQPMLELLDYLRANRFKTYIVSGGGADFVRPWSEKIYGIPPEQVIGSNAPTEYRDDPPRVVRLPELTPTVEEHDEEKYKESLFIDDKSGKPVGIQRHIGRRPILAFGNSDGDLYMLRWATASHRKSLGLLLNHTDGVNEYDYSNPSTTNESVGHLSGSTITEAEGKGWVVVDMANDWDTVYPSGSGQIETATAGAGAPSR